VSATVLIGGREEFSNGNGRIEFCDEEPLVHTKNERNQIVTVHRDQKRKENSY
jgi:hypothetical protein